MAVPFNAAASAYGNAARLITESAKGAPKLGGDGQGAGGDFASLLSQSLQGLVDQGKSSDTKMMNLVNGKGDVVDVVTAVSQTELAVESMVAVRDRVISAYEDIMKMPI